MQAAPAQLNGSYSLNNLGVMLGSMNVENNSGSDYS
jgi:hypothetical protein